MKSSKTNVQDLGYVMPMVLVFIIVFATITLIGVETAQDGQRLTRSLQARAIAERTLVSAESRALFAIATATPVLGGYDLAATGPTDALAALDGPKPSQEADDFWPVNGGIRRIAPSVIVRVQDAAGLLSVNDANLDELEILLEALGLSDQEARRLNARLADYRDADSLRSFLGAERPAYRLANMTPPTNSPLRDVAELENVLGWSDHLVDLKAKGLLDYLTADIRSFEPVRGLYPSQLDNLLSQQSTLDAKSSSSGAMFQRSSSPSARIRLDLMVDLTLEDGRIQVLQRRIEIERRPIAVDRPFYRYFIDDQLIEKDPDDRPSNIQPLFP